eukprot:GHVS01004819.1.p2 GENE.GHVS01004819.1~~GHVS01004819.1.p2  ORF type:complete len:666 (-),score=172.75 GHVS01004819.1:3295-5292(-)
MTEEEAAISSEDFSMTESRGDVGPRGNSCSEGRRREEGGGGWGSSKRMRSPSSRLRGGGGRQEFRRGDSEREESRRRESRRRYSGAVNKSSRRSPPPDSDRPYNSRNDNSRERQHEQSEAVSTRSSRREDNKGGQEDSFTAAIAAGADESVDLEFKGEDGGDTDEVIIPDGSAIDEIGGGGIPDVASSPPPRNCLLPVPHPRNVGGGQPWVNSGRLPPPPPAAGWKDGGGRGGGAVRLRTRVQGCSGDFDHVGPYGGGRLISQPALLSLVNVPRHICQAKFVHDWFFRFGPLLGVRCDSVHCESFVEFKYRQDAEAAMQHPALLDIPNVQASLHIGSPVHVDQPRPPPQAEECPPMATRGNRQVAFGQPAWHAVERPTTRADGHKYESQKYQQHKEKKAFQERQKAGRLSKLNDLSMKYTEKLKEAISRLSDKNTDPKDKDEIQKLIQSIKQKLKVVAEQIQNVQNPRISDTERQLEDQLETLKKEAESRGVSLSVLKHSMASDPYKLDLRTTSLKLSDLPADITTGEKFQDWIVEHEQLCGRSIEFITPVVDSETSQLTGSYIVKYLDRATSENVLRTVQVSGACKAQWYNDKLLPRGVQPSSSACESAELAVGEEGGVAKRRRLEEEGGDEEEVGAASDHQQGGGGGSSGHHVESAEVDYGDE